MANCSVDDMATFETSMKRNLWKHDALLVSEAALAGVIVGIGAYGQRYRHHPFTRFIFLGATTLFLPIISSVVSAAGTNANFIIPVESTYGPPPPLIAICTGTNNSIALVLWALFVQIIMTNTSIIVAVDDREGQSKGPPLDLLVQGAWTIYLGFSVISNKDFPLIHNLPEAAVELFALLFAKLAVKCYAFQKARWSYALGRNPGLILVYMQQLQAQEANQNGEPPVCEDAPPPPKLLVMGEEEKQVEMHPRGYSFKADLVTLNNSIGLVTIDRVWTKLDSALPIATPRLKDLCLSFALFKLLRCRFARYNLTNAGSMGTVTFFRSLLLNVGGHDRVFRVIADELSFVHDYYYSSLPISYSKCCLPILSIILSLLCTAFCLVGAIAVVATLQETWGLDSQVLCRVWCIKQPLVNEESNTDIGRLYFDLVPVLLLVVLAMVAEVRDMASYICSNWTKVTLICGHVNRTTASSQHSLRMPKWVSLLLRCRCKLMKHWDEKMSQCSVLVLPSRPKPLLLVWPLLHWPGKRSKVKVPVAVKICIVNALTSSINGGLNNRNGVASLRPSQVGESFLWACNGKDGASSDTILVWHIATCIFEVKHPYRREQGSPPVFNSDHKIAATHLSRYCAYLVSWCPELLPDNNAWSKSLYKAVKKDAERALAGHALARSSTPEEEYQKLVELLSTNSKHEVLKNGVKLGKQLVESINSEETAWKLLAGFWSEMILYVAPSDNLKGHSEAIARGGELITLLWALLFHAGIVSRTGEEDAASAATCSGAV